MSTPQILTDDQAAAIWSGDTASILNFEGNTPAVTTEVTTPDTQATTEPIVTQTLVSDEELTKVWAETEEDEDDDEEEVKNPQASTTPTTTQTTDNEPKRGRKVADLVNLVNQLTEEGVLFGYEEGEIKTIDEAKELIKENLKYKEEVSEDKVWEKKVQQFSPQVQAILHYANKGGQDITPLLSAISEVEKSSNIDVEQEDGQEEIVRQVLKIKGFDDEEIKDQIDTLKDLDRLKKKAEKFLPELNKMKEQRIQMMMQEQEENDRQAKEAARVYIQTIQDTLDSDQVGDLKLKKEDKFKIIEALAVPRYRSINGFQVNEFVKKLEEMQFGKNADYQHFLNIVHLTVDKQGFMDKLKETMKTEITSDTVRKLKTAKTSSANSPQDTTPDNTNRKNVIQRGGFKNPYAK